MVFSVFAEIPIKFDDKYNSLSITGLSNPRFYLDDFSSYENYMMYYVDLKPNTEYTFFSTLGSRRFFVGPKVDFGDFSGCCGFDSINYIYIPYNFSFGVYDEFEISSGDMDGQIVITSSSTSSRDYYFLYTEIILEPGTYYFNDFVPAFSSRCVSYITYGSNYIYSGDSFTLTERTEVECRLAIYSGFNSSVILSPMLTKDVSYDYFIPGYSKVHFLDNYTTLFTFNTNNCSGIPSISGHVDFVLGINDVTYGNESELFSRYQSEENLFYLIEGSYSVEDISLILDGDRYQNGYDDGYDDGYSKGETSGLESSMFMRNIFFTIVSSPFIFIRNALDFDFLGINFRDIAMIIISATLVAWVIRVFKKGE